MRFALLSLIPILVSVTFPVSALAATFDFDVVVTESVDVEAPADFRPEYDLPDIGTTGTVSITLDDAFFSTLDPIPPEFDSLASVMSVSASIGDLTASLSVPSIAAFDSVVLFRNGSFSSIAVDIPTSVTDATLAGGFRTPVPGGVAPTTVSDIFALVSDPNAAFTFSFNGTVNAGFDFVSFRAEAITPVPLPAGGLLLLTGLGGLAVARRRHAGS